MQELAVSKLLPSHSVLTDAQAVKNYLTHNSLSEGVSDLIKIEFDQKVGVFSPLALTDPNAIAVEVLRHSSYSKLWRQLDSPAKEEIFKIFSTPSSGQSDVLNSIALQATKGDEQSAIAAACLIDLSLRASLGGLRYLDKLKAVFQDSTPETSIDPFVDTLTTSAELGDELMYSLLAQRLGESGSSTAWYGLLGSLSECKSFDPLPIISEIAQAGIDRADPNLLELVREAGSYSGLAQEQPLVFSLLSGLKR
jgi:hypothetical protein